MLLVLLVIVIQGWAAILKIISTFFSLLFFICSSGPHPLLNLFISCLIEPFLIHLCHLERGYPYVHSFKT